MFLRPFLKYLKPHKTRLLIAFVAMLGVGFFSTYNILLAKPALDVLFGQVNYHEREARVDEDILDDREKLEELAESNNFVDKLNVWRRRTYYPVEHMVKRRIYGSSFYKPGEFENPEKLADALRYPQTSAAAHIKRQLSASTLRLLEEIPDSAPPPPLLIEFLANDINAILAQPGLYRPDLFQNVRLSTNTIRNLIEPYYIASQTEEIQYTTESLTRVYEDLTQSQRVRVNRILLERALPAALKSDRPMSLYRYADKNETKCLRWIAGLIVLMALVNGLLEFCFKYNLSFSLFSAVIALKSALFRHVMYQDLRFFTNRSVGFLMSRITSDVQALRTTFDIIIKNAVQQAIQLVFLFSLLLVINPKMTAMVFLMILPCFAILAWFASLLRKVARKQKRKQDSLSAAMNESLGSVRLIKALATEDIECERFDKHNFKLLYYQMKQRVAKFASSPIMEVLGAMAVALILMVGGYAVLRGELMEPSDFLIYIIALAAFYKPVKRLSRINVNWQMGRISAERISEILALEPTVTDPPENVKPVQIPRIQRGIFAKNVTFAYEEKTILKNISAEFPQGAITAIVGRSGSGKTTLANLLLRLYDPDEGAIEIDGHDIRQFRVKDLRAHFGIVTQEAILFDDTVANNITYGSKTVDREKIIEAARAAHAHEFVEALDGGKAYDTSVGPRGSKLSGGQRQRIAIARAFYRDPDILLLDEATSSLDTEAEKAIQENLAPLMENRTVIVIAHRLSTVVHADNIIVLHHGRIVEQGTHDELIALGKHYATLYKLGEFSQG